MRLLGASALCADAVVQELAAAAFEGRAAFVWLDGEDMTAVFAEAGEGVPEVLTMAAKVLPFQS